MEKSKFVPKNMEEAIDALYGIMSFLKNQSKPLWNGGVDMESVLIETARDRLIQKVNVETDKKVNDFLLKEKILNDEEMAKLTRKDP